MAYSNVADQTMDLSIPLKYLNGIFAVDKYISLPDSVAYLTLSLNRKSEFLEERSTTAAQVTISGKAAVEVNRLNFVACYCNNQEIN